MLNPTITAKLLTAVIPDKILGEIETLCADGLDS